VNVLLADLGCCGIWAINMSLLVTSVVFSERYIKLTLAAVGLAFSSVFFVLDGGGKPMNKGT